MTELVLFFVTRAVLDLMITNHQAFTGSASSLPLDGMLMLHKKNSGPRRANQHHLRDLKTQPEHCV